MIAPPVDVNRSSRYGDACVVSQVFVLLVFYLHELLDGLLEGRISLA